MAFKKRCVRLWPLYCELKVLPLDILVQIEYGKTLYKFGKGLLPANFENYFRKPAHQHNTRFATANDNYQFIQSMSRLERSRLKFIGPKMWMLVPVEIKHSLSVKVFVKSYRNHLIGNHIDYS